MNRNLFSFGFILLVLQSSYVISQSRFSAIPSYVYPETRVEEDEGSSRQDRTARQQSYSQQMSSQWREACPSGATGDFPYSGDCRKYLSCWKGRGVLRLCSPGTLFNPLTMECDFPEKVTCHTHSKRSYGTHWHANPANIQSVPPSQQSYPGGTENRNSYRPYHGHHHSHHHNHPPGQYWGHPHDHHHHHHTHGYNGLPTYTPNDRRYNGGSRRRTDHSGVQPPSNGYLPVASSVPSTDGADCKPDTAPQPAPTPSPYPEYDRNNPGQRHLTRIDEDETFSQSKPTQKTPVGRKYPTDEYEQRFPPRYPNERPQSGLDVRPDGDIGLQPPSQDFDTNQLPYCDEEEVSPADLPEEGSHRQARLALPPAICPRRFNGLIAHPDCTKFLSCANGRTFVMDCSPGTRFNPERLICDYPRNVKCAYDDLVDLDPAGTSITETNQQITTGTKRRPQYDFDMDVRFGVRSEVRCQPRKDSVGPNPPYTPPQPRVDDRQPDLYPTQPISSENRHDTQYKRPDYSSSAPSQNRPNYSDPPPQQNPNYGYPYNKSVPFNHPTPPRNRPSYTDPPQRQNSLNPSHNRPNFSDPPPFQNRPNYGNTSRPQNRPNYVDPPRRQNRPNYSEPIPSPNRPSYANPPPRQFGPNFVDSTTKPDRPWIKDVPRKNDPPSQWVTTTTRQPFNADDDLQIRFGDQDWQESIPDETIITTTKRPYQGIQNEFEVITARPIVVTGRTIRTKPTTTQTTTIPPTVQHVFRPEITISLGKNNKTKHEQPGWQVLRLRGGPSPIEGFVEIQITFGAWGILCDKRNQWSLEEANIVCKNLGYSRGADQSWQGKPAEGRMSKSSVIAANNVRCVGHEENILECYISGGGSCDIEKDAIWVRCHPNSVSACQPGETSFDGKCYSLVVPKADDADSSVGFSQGEALAHCKSKGARLADFTSQQENDYLSEWLVFSDSVDSIMTSGVGVSVMGHSIWIWEGSEDPFSYSNWWPGWGGSSKGLSPQLDSGRALCIVARRYYPCASFQVANSGRTNSSEPLLCDAEYFFWDVEDCSAMSSNHPYICERPADKVGCVVSNGESYTGPANVTGNGEGCLPWDEEDVVDRLQFKISEDDFRKRLNGHNSCRNVGGGEVLPWCFANTTNGVRKHLCDIPKCGKGVQQKSAKMADYTCKEGEFTCGFNNECIPTSWVCDGEQDCINGADEDECSKILDRFSLMEGHRLYGHDNEKWLQTSAASCAQRCVEVTDFQCRSFSHSAGLNECILSDSNVGLSGALSANDSSWNYHELNSLSIRCTQHFICDNGKCISTEQHCNGHNDCGDKSDEKNCSWTSTDIQVRLTGDPQPHRGTIEIKFKEEWGLVCDDEFDLVDGDVICRQLGYSGVFELLKHSISLSNPNNLTKYQVDNLQCEGNETHISQCEHNGWGIHDCAPTESAGVVCKNASVDVAGDNVIGGQEVPSNMWKCESSDELIHIDFLCDNVPDCTDRSDEDMSRCKSAIEVRLVGVSRSSRPEGRLEVRRFGIWGTVCDDDFGQAEAQVICRALGHKGPAKAYKNARFGAGSGVIWLDSVHCSGNESSVEKCLHEGWGQTNCKHDEDVSVVCSFDLALNGSGSPTSHTADEDDQLLPEDCGTISQDLDPTTPSRFSARVVSGFETVKGTYPWQGSVRLKSAGGRSAHWCGAVVMGKRYALTAGHCLRDYVKSHYFIRAGDYDTQTDEGSEQDVEIEEMWIHEDLDKGARLNNDLALVRVKAPGFTFNSWVQPACIPKNPLQNHYNCTISGWGTTSNPGSGFARTLHAAWLTPLKKEECSSEKVYGKDALSAGMFCAGSLVGGPDSCQGDSGGPFVCPIRGKHTLFGITSWGHGCGRANSPGVYTDLWHYRQWLSDTLAKSAG